MEVCTQCILLLVFHPVQMARYRRKLMQTLQSLKKEDLSVEAVLEAFSLASFLEEFDSAVEELYTDFTPSVIEKVQEFLNCSRTLHTYNYVCTYVRMYVLTYVCMYLRTYVCTYVSVYSHL